MPSITAAQARLLIPSLTADAEDTAIALLVTRADAAMAKKLGYPPASAGAGETYASTSYTHYSGRYPEVVRLDSRRLLLPVRPVTAVASIYDDPDWSYGASTLVASSDYVVDGEAGIVTLKPSATHGGWSDSRGAIKVAYTAGWSTYPPDMQQAVAMLVQHWWRLRREGGRLSLGSGPSNESLRDETVPEAVVELVAGRVLPSVVA